MMTMQSMQRPLFTRRLAASMRTVSVRVPCHQSLDSAWVTPASRAVHLRSHFTCEKDVGRRTMMRLSPPSSPRCHYSVSAASSAIPPSAQVPKLPSAALEAVYQQGREAVQKFILVRQFPPLLKQRNLDGVSTINKSLVVVGQSLLSFIAFDFFMSHYPNLQTVHLRSVVGQFLRREHRFILGRKLELQKLAYELSRIHSQRLSQTTDAVPSTPLSPPPTPPPPSSSSSPSPSLSLSRNRDETSHPAVEVSAQLQQPSPSFEEQQQQMNSRRENMQISNLLTVFIAAIHDEHGFDKTKQFLGDRLFMDEHLDVTEALKDVKPVTVLKRLVKLGLYNPLFAGEIPVYDFAQHGISDHFAVVSVGDIPLGQGIGPTVKEAKDKAAQHALNKYYTRYVASPHGLGDGTDTAL